MNKIVYLYHYDKNDKRIDDDFERFKNISTERAREFMGELIGRFPKLYGKSTHYEIWKLDKNCYHKIGEVPFETGGVEHLLHDAGVEV